MLSSFEKIKQLSRRQSNKDYAELIDEAVPPPLPISQQTIFNEHTTYQNSQSVQYGVNNAQGSKISINMDSKNSANKTPEKPYFDQNFNYEQAKTITGKTKKMKKLMLQHVGYRLSKRKDLHLKRRKVGDIMFVLGLLGVLLAVWLIELNFADQHQHLLMRHSMSKKFQYWNKTEASVILRFLISVTTIALSVLVFVYHHLDIKLYCINNTIDDWRIALTPSRLFFIVGEFLICIIHPIPGSIILNWSTESIETINTSNSSETRIDKISDSVPLDILLAVPMFSRLYLLCRILLLHSKLVTDASSQSLGYLNRINFNFRFVFKAYMTQSPEYVLTFLTLLLFIIGSWCLKACEYHVDAEKFGLLNSMWLVAITFLTVGYGDYYPNTYCGRTISVMSGLFGVFCTALLVALITRKLEFTRSERYVYQFVSEVELKKELTRAAANVIKQGWKIHRLKKSTGPNSKMTALKEQEIIHRQRTFLVNIQTLRKIQQEVRKIDDNAVTTLELYRQQTDINLLTQKLFKICENLDKKVNHIEDKMDTLEIGLRSVQDMIASSKLK